MTNALANGESKKKCHLIANVDFFFFFSYFDFQVDYMF